MELWLLPRCPHIYTKFAKFCFTRDYSLLSRVGIEKTKICRSRQINIISPLKRQTAMESRLNIT